MTQGRTGSGRKAGAPRRGGGLRALAASLPKVTGKAFGRRGLAAGGLVADWPGIVGEQLAAVSLPRGLSRTGQGTLTVRVESGHAPTLQHLEPLVIERINSYLGYQAVTRLRLQQGPLGGRSADTRPPPTPPTPLSEEEEAGLQARTGSVDDETLRGALERLGRAVKQGSGG